MKKIAALLLSFALLLSLCACSMDPTLVGTTPCKETGSELSQDTNTAAFKLGDVVELDNVTVGFTDVIISNGSDYNKPNDGNVFVLCEFEITNDSDEELSVSSMLCFDAYCDGYASSLSLQALMEKGEKAQLDGTIAAGKKMKGVVGYEVPSDWQELEIHYTIDIVRDNTIIFTATNEQ